MVTVHALYDFGIISFQEGVNSINLAHDLHYVDK